MASGRATGVDTRGRSSLYWPRSIVVPPISILCAGLRRRGARQRERDIYIRRGRRRRRGGERGGRRKRRVGRWRGGGDGAVSASSSLQWEHGAGARAARPDCAEVWDAKRHRQACGWGRNNGIAIGAEILVIVVVVIVGPAMSPAGKASPRCGWAISCALPGAWPAAGPVGCHGDMTTITTVRKWRWGEREGGAQGWRGGAGQGQGARRPIRCASPILVQL